MDARMDDSAVVAARLLAIPRVLFKHVHAFIMLRNLCGNSQTYDACSYDHNVDRFHGYHGNT
jgi:hypothetical protein